MSRMKVLVGNPRMALGALLTLLLSAGAVVGSGADFTASSANPTNKFTAGTLTMANSETGTAVLTANNLRPGGDAETGVVDIENTGSLSGAFTLAHSALVNSDTGNPMSEKLNIKIVDCGDFASGTPTCDTGDDVKYEGTLVEMGTPGHEIEALGDYDADEKHRYEFSVDLDGTADDRYQGDSSTVTFDFNSTTAS
jgi:Camelysin metallo-endopeptidase